MGHPAKALTTEDTEDTEDGPNQIWRLLLQLRRLIILGMGTSLRCRLWVVAMTGGVAETFPTMGRGCGVHG